jgi:hypothetical protein
MKLRRFFVRLITSVAIATTIGAAMAPLAATPAMGACNPGDLSITGGINCAAPTSASQRPLFGNGSLFQTIANVIIYIVGAIAVLMVIIGGLRYVLSTGNPQATAGAKDTILFAVIGVIVAALAFAIVNFVIVRLNRPDITSPTGVTRFG